MLVPPCDNWPHCTSANNVFVWFLYLSLSVSNLNFIIVINIIAVYLLRCPARTFYSLEHACYVVSFFLSSWFSLYGHVSFNLLILLMSIIVHHQKAVNTSKYGILVNKLAHSKHDGSNEISNKKEKCVCVCQKVMISYRIKHVSYQQRSLQM